MQKNGFFITFEGGDGSGKTTIINMVYQQLLKDFPQKKIILTREPGASDNPLCVEIRNLLLNKDIKVDHRCEALLFAADRAQHVGLCLKPSLEEGALILCDRYIDSSIVYQGFARKLGVDQI
jgi:dTMP kinase